MPAAKETFVFLFRKLSAIFGVVLILVIAILVVIVVAILCAVVVFVAIFRLRIVVIRISHICTPFRTSLSVISPLRPI